MTMKRFTAGMLVLALIISMMLMGACRQKEPEVPADTDKETVEKSTGGSEDETAKAEEEDEGISDAKEPDTDVVKTFEPDSEKVIEHDLPMQIEAVYLYRDGTVRIVPADDLKKNELGDSEADSMMPFTESGEVSDIYLMRIGNGGYRTIVALMKDGTVSAVNTRALIEDHIIAVMDNVGGRDSFTGIEQEESEDGFAIIGKTEEGDDVVLDPVLLNDNPEPQPAE